MERDGEAALCGVGKVLGVQAQPCCAWQIYLSGAGALLPNPDHSGSLCSPCGHRKGSEASKLRLAFSSERKEGFRRKWHVLCSEMKKSVAEILMVNSRYSPSPGSARKGCAGVSPPCKETYRKQESKKTEFWRFKNHIWLTCVQCSLYLF